MASSDHDLINDESAARLLARFPTPATTKPLVKPIYSIDAPDQQRLKIARLEIEALLRKHDLAGVVVLHTPGMSEYFYDVRPSYSCAWIDESIPMMRMKSKLADYNGDRTTMLHDQAATANMMRAIADNLAGASAMFQDIADVIDRTLGSQHFGGAAITPDPAEGRRQ